MSSSRNNFINNSDSGTVAIWYSPIEASETESEYSTPTEFENPQLNLHVNLWRIGGISQRTLGNREGFGKKGPTTFLDMGLELKHIERVAQLNVFIPAQLDQTDVLDLSPALKSQQTLKAVFNDIVEISNTTDDSFTVKKQNSKEGWARRIWMLRKGDINLEDVADDRYPGKILTFKEAVLKRIQAASQKTNCVDYIRIRLILSSRNQSFCITELSASTFGLNPREAHQETIEFRLNERRSFPEDIEARASAGRFDLNSVNYFLITNTKQEITTQHTQFKRVRQLEMPLWLDYITGGTRSDPAITTSQEKSQLPATQENPPPKPSLRLKRLKKTKLSIYQWSEKTSPKEDQSKKIDDFSAYATFASTKSVVLSYVFIALLMGTISSLLSTFFWPWICEGANLKLCQGEVTTSEPVKVDTSEPVKVDVE